MSYRLSQECLGTSNNHFGRRTFAAERETFSRDIFPAVSHPELNVKVFLKDGRVPTGVPVMGTTPLLLEKISFVAA